MDKKYYLDAAGLQLYDILIKNYITDTDKVLYGNSEDWNSQPNLMSKRGYVYIYSDWCKDPSGNDIAGFKVGDGVTRLYDIPFTDHMYAEHIADTVIHITQQERENWNDKVTCFYKSDLERLIFSK